MADAARETERLLGIMARLRDPASWVRMPNFRKLFEGLFALLRRRREPARTRLFTDPPLPATVILARGDPTALTYRAATHGAFAEIRTASHSFADVPGELEAVVLAAIRRYSAA